MPGVPQLDSLWQDLRFAVEFLGFIEKWTMPQRRQMLIELGRYGSSIGSSVVQSVIP